MRIRSLYILGCLLVWTSVLSAQRLIKEIPLSSPQMMTTDELGNVYVVTQGGSITKWSRDGDSLCNYRTATNHQILALDATNPLELYVVQSRINRLQILDRMLSLKTELNLKQLNIMNFTALAQSRDGNFWVFDNIAQKLKKFDRQLNPVLESNDMRTEHQLFLNPTHIEERNDRLVVSDEIGLLIFDRYASLIQVYEHLFLERFQLLGDLILGFDGKSITVLNLSDQSQTQIEVPQLNCDIKEARVETDRMYLLCPHALYIYEWRL